MAKVLIVDDEEFVRGSIRFAMKRAGHETMEAQNGLEADELLLNNSFDLVITDIIMPEKEGISLILDLNKNFPAVKVIAITGGGKETHQKLNLENAAMFGAHATLQKPFSLEELLSTVDKCLSGKKEKSQNIQE